MQRIRRFMKGRRRWLALALILLVAALGTTVVLGGDGPVQEDARGERTEVLGAQAEADDPGDQADTLSPDLTVSFPAAGGPYGAGIWDAGCAAAPGVCGIASDESGIASVELSLRRQGGGYWTGTGFDSDAAVFLLLDTAGAPNWSYPLARPADGAYVLTVRATDAAGNTTPPDGLVTRTFRIDTAAPAAPVIVTHPDDITFDESAAFGFTHPEPDVTFRCRLDDGAAAPCGRDVDYPGLSTTDHRFQVWAVDAAGNAGPGAEYSWAVLIRTDFDVEGAAGLRLRLGVGTALDLRITNPFKFPIRVVEMSVDAKGPAACPAAENLESVNARFASAVVIPARSARSLSELDIPVAEWPHLKLRNRNVNQDGCKNVTFELTYGGTGTKS